MATFHARRISAAIFHERCSKLTLGLKCFSSFDNGESLFAKIFH